ncbi:MAG: 4'-phosphopantetheinyl transferase superfamily protein [Clostridiales bacterium]|nr:4'-phosphopantetheinyl transferase superfamily protein [Clostridiales bacterium]
MNIYICSEYKDRDRDRDNILRYILKKNFPGTKPCIKKNKRGKPYVSNIRGCYFSISHTRNILVIAVDKLPIGVDIEKIRDVNFKIVNRFFSKEDIKKFETVEQKERKDYFFKMWTQKESYVKCIGTGFSGMPFSKFTINEDTLVCDKQCKYHFCTYNVDGGYKMSVCYSSDTDMNLQYLDTSIIV